MIQTKTIPVVGMACSSCSAHVERTLNEQKGVNHASVNLAMRTALVEFDDSITNLPQLKAAVNAIGFDLIVEENRSAEEVERRELSLLRRRTLLAWLSGAAVMAVPMLAGKDSHTAFTLQLQLMLALFCLIACARQFYTAAWKQLRHGMASMDTLVAFSTAISFTYSAIVTFHLSTLHSPLSTLNPPLSTYFDASVMIVAFVLTGRLIEERAKRATASSIRQLMGLQPKTARLVKQTFGHSVQDGTGNGEADFDLVPLSTVSIGDVVEVRAGEKIPVDGTVTQATSFMNEKAAYVDESMLTGEATPVAKQAMATRVHAGTVVSQGKLRLRATQVGEHTALAQIIDMVQRAQGSKAPVQRVVDRMAAIFVPVVTAIALVTFFAWFLAGAGWSQAVVSAVAVLVVACPCAMGLATPTALMVGIGKAAERNILIKDAAALEELRKVDAIVIDKTGTLTIPNQQIDFTRADQLDFEEREQLKPHAREAVDELHAEGIHLCLMSGDRHDAVAHWAAQAGITDFKSQVKPADKEEKVSELKAQGKHVAMVGDGINDSQALALADVSIAIGTGTDVAIDVAQVTLMGNDLRTLPEAIRLSRSTVKMIRQNLFWAFIYNLTCIPLAAGLPRALGYDLQLTPMWASALMACSSLSVVLNSLRLKLTH